MADRVKLQAMLEDILGSRNVYFQPPSSIKMNFPAIVYSVNNIENIQADNAVYRQNKSYEIIVIDRTPDSAISEKISRLPLCRFNRHYVADNLNHDVFTLYF